MDSMESLNTDDWDIVKSIQKMWIGNCNGCFIDFTLKVEINIFRLAIFKFIFKQFITTQSTKINQWKIHLFQCLLKYHKGYMEYRI